MKPLPFFRGAGVVLVILMLSHCASPPATTEPQPRSIPSAQTLAAAVLDSVHQTQALPGFAVSVFTPEEVVYTQSWSNREGADLVGHSQVLASVTKMLTGLRLSAAVEDGLIALDAPVQPYLPFFWAHPQRDEVTFLQLATHTSGTEDPALGDQGYRFSRPLNPTDFSEAYAPLLDGFNTWNALDMQGYLYKRMAINAEAEQGATYLDLPGEAYNYSNLGIALLSLALDSVTGTDLKTWFRVNYTGPLALTQTAWSYKELDPHLQSVMVNEDGNVVPAYNVVTYPDGGLWTSVKDLTRLAQRWMQEARGDHGARLQSIHARAREPHYDAEDSIEGLCTDLNFPGLVGHAGNDFGTATLLYLQPEAELGRILFAPVTVEYEAQEEAFYGIFNTLFDIDWTPTPAP